MSKPYFDRETRKMVFPEPEAKTSNGNVSKTGIAIDDKRLGKLHAVILGDGFKPDQDADEKKATRQLNSMARITIEGLIDAYLAERAGGSKTGK